MNTVTAPHATHATHATHSAQTLLAPIVLAPAALTRDFAKAMLKDVTPAMFARLAAPGGMTVQSNHPAWAFGHLSIYNCRVLELLGQPAGAAAVPAGFDELFKNGTPCQDDAKGTIYPTMEAVTSFYFAGFDAAVTAIKHASDAQLSEANPAEGRMKELFPTKGMVINFLMSTHHMIHLGQVSAWRRMQGLGSAM